MKLKKIYVKDDEMKVVDIEVKASGSNQGGKPHSSNNAEESSPLTLMNLVNTPETSSSSPREQLDIKANENDYCSSIHIRKSNSTSMERISLRSSTLRVSPEDLKNQSAEVIVHIQLHMMGKQMSW